MFNTATKRVLYRLVEIGVVSSAIGILTAPQMESFIPPVLTGVVAAVLKALREFRSRLTKE